MKRFSFKKPKSDLILSFTVFFLLLFGLIMMSSASAVVSYETFGYNNYFLYRQIVYVIVGLVGLVIAQKLPYSFWKSIALPFLGVSFALNVLVMIPGIGVNHGGAQSWINLGFFQFQPSEILKLALIVYLASWLDAKRKDIHSFKNVFIPFCILLGVVAGILMKQPDLGSLLVIAFSMISIYFVAGVPLIYLGLISGGGVMATFLLIKAAPYRLARLMTFLHPEQDPLGVGFHINQALIAVGSGGLWGRGFGKSGQKYTGYIPETPNDSIFAIIAEELGFIKLLIAPILLFIIFAWRGLVIASHASDFFGKLLAFGITSWITMQALLNMATMLSLVPLTGLTLPFISYGGTSIIVSLVAVGILLNISKYQAAS
ncbi:MAG: putative lipid II flippase FtsW [Patescibacteria group bacterium]